MVRNLAGTLVGFGRNKIRTGDIHDILERRDRQAAGVTAPAAGLCLEYVEYEQPVFGELSLLNRRAHRE
jgi:tRNA pseudouridine38-40 synthase